MAQHGSQYYPSLVHQHNTLSQPPSLSASGTFALSTNAHDMLTNATTHDSPSPPSTSSSSSRLDQPPVFSMPPALPAQATDHDSYKTRYERDPRYDPALMEEEIDTDRIVIRHQIRRHFHEAVKQRDGARPYRVPGSRVVDPDSQIYDRMGARPNPSPQPHPPFPSDERRSHVQESLSPSPSSQHSSITYAPSHSRSGSSSASSSAPRNESPVFGVETSLLPHPSLETPGSLVHLLWAPTKTTPNLGGKNKKQRLYSVDRKVICEFAQQNPSYKQEEIARKFNIERSTVSKILKNKHRWLRVSNDETVYYAKDRHAKFPGLEMYMKEWVKKCHEDNVPMTDALIAARALELARARGYTEKEFKASPGWVENFKHRVGISKNRWHGRTKWHKSMTTLPEDMETMDDKIEARRWHEEDDLPALPEPTPEELALTQQVQPTPAVPRQEPLTIEYTRVDTPPQVRRHPVWLPDHQDDVDRPSVDEPRLGYSNTPAHAASSARPYESQPIIEPPVGVTAYSEDGSAHIVVPQGPNYRPNVGAEPSHNDAETSIDTLLIFFKNVRPDMLSMEQRHLLHTIKEELFMAGN